MDLLLVEDDEAFAADLRGELESLGHVVEVAANGAEALRTIARRPIDAIILDSMLPRMSGAKVVKEMRDRGQNAPVLMLSALGRTEQKIGGLEAGADDYVVKPAAASEIDARLRALIRARNLSDGDGDTLRAGDIVVSPLQYRAWRAEKPLELTKLELNLLAELTRHAGSFLTRAMLIERVWGFDFEPTTNLVDVQIRSLRRKLMAHGDPDPIETKRGIGYMLQG